MWENIIKQLSKWGEVVVDKSGFYFKKAVDKGEELTKIGRIQIDIEKLKRDINHKYLELGKFVFEHGDNDNINTEDEEYREIVESIRNLKAELDQKHQEKENVKKEGEKEGENTEEPVEAEIIDD